MRRREFIKTGTSALLTVPFILSRPGSVFATSEASPIVTVKDDKAFSLKFRPGDLPNEDNVIPDKIISTGIDHLRIAQMVDTTILKLTGKNTVGKAWESLFPAGHPRPDTTIVIKINFSYGNMADRSENTWIKNICPFGPKSAITNAIVAGLAQMNEGTFPIENITLFDSTYLPEKQIDKLIVQGFRPIEANGLGVYKDSQPGAVNMHLANFLKTWEFSPDTPPFTAAPDYPEKYQAHQRINSAIYHNDFMINITHPKDHRAAGITGVMKNMYGCTDNPMGTHGWDWNAKDNPYPGTGICVPVFYKMISRQTPCILNIIDAMAGLYQGGPLAGKVFQANTLAISRDPVALDTWELEMVNRIRKKNGYTIITTEDGFTADGHPNASFLRIATENHQMGNSSLQNVREYDISSATKPYYLPSLQNPLSLLSEVTKTGKDYQVGAIMDRSGRKHTIRAVIKNAEGDIIKTYKTIVTKSDHKQLRWDHRNDHRVTMPPGLYIWHITVDGNLHTGTINDYYV